MAARRNPQAITGGPMSLLIRVRGDEGTARAICR